MNRLEVDIMDLYAQNENSRFVNACQVFHTG